METKIKALEANLEQTKAKLKVATEALQRMITMSDCDYSDFHEEAKTALEQITIIDGF